METLVENIYDLNFNNQQINFLKETKITKEPTLMYVIKKTILHIPKAGCYQGSDQIILNEGDRFTVRKEKGFALLESGKSDESFSGSFRWQKYVNDIKRKNTFVPIAVFTIN